MTVNLSSGQTRAAAGPTGPAAARRTWAPLAVMLTGTFMIVLDFFIVNVAIPSIQRDLHAGAAGIEWVITAYGLTYGVGLITGGRLGDRYGRRRMFLIGLALFTLASLACGLADSATVLITSRAIQGLGAAVAGPQTLALVGVAYEGRQRVTAVTAYGVTLGLAAVLGQLFGGLLIQANVLGLDWRSCFLVNLPVGLAALIAAPRLVAESRGQAGDRIDLVGTTLVTAGLVAIILPLVDGRQQHWPAWAWGCLAAAMPILAVFVAHQAWRRRRGRTPLIDLSALAGRTVRAGLIATGVFYCAMASFFVVLALYLQEGRGMSALGSGAMFTAVGGGYLAASLVPGAIHRPAGPAVAGAGRSGHGGRLRRARPHGHVRGSASRADADGAATDHRHRHGHADRAAHRDRARSGRAAPRGHRVRTAVHDRPARQLARGGGHRGRVLRRPGRRFRARLRRRAGLAHGPAARRRRSRSVPAAGAGLSGRSLPGSVLRA
jgi:MFS family permease